jgi:AraC family transcriptional activator of tynA and feaB
VLALRSKCRFERGFRDKIRTPFSGIHKTYTSLVLSFANESLGATAMSETFSTELIPAADRIEAWEWNARRFCGDCRFHFPSRRRFHGSMASKNLSEVSLSVFSSSALSFQKFPAASAHSENRFCTVITQLEGARWYSQNDAVVVLKPGDSTLIDSAAPWCSDCLGDCVRLYVRVPRWLIEDRLRTTLLPSARRISAATAPGGALFRLAISLYRETDGLSHEEAAAMLEAYFGVLSGCLGVPRTDTGAGNSDRILACIETFIEGHLAESTLGPVEVAAAVGISVRHAHRLFAKKACTIGDWIRQRRLERCRADLACPRLHDRTITDIAFGWGFSESAHFSRSFKQQFGICPRTFRSQVWGDSWQKREPDRNVQDFLVAVGSRQSRPN